LEYGEGLCLEFDEFNQLLVILMSNNVDKFGGCFENKVGGVVVERVCCFGVVGNDIASCLRRLLVRGGLGELFDEERTKIGNVLVSLGFGFPFVDGSIRGTGMFYGIFDECKMK